MILKTIILLVLTFIGFNTVTIGNGNIPIDETVSNNVLIENVKELGFENVMSINNEIVILDENAEVSPNYLTCSDSPFWGTVITSQSEVKVRTLEHDFYNSNNSYHGSFTYSELYTTSTETITEGEIETSLSFEYLEIKSKFKSLTRYSVEVERKIGMTYTIPKYTNSKLLFGYYKAVVSGERRFYNTTCDILHRINLGTVEYPITLDGGNSYRTWNAQEFF